MIGYPNAPLLYIAMPTLLVADLAYLAPATAGMSAGRAAGRVVTPIESQASSDSAIETRMFVSVTRLRVRGLRYLPGFLWHAGTSALQLRHAPGFIVAELSPDFRTRVFWTVSVWRDEQSMRAYRISGAHMRAMPKLLDWCDEAAVAHWAQSGDTLPGHDESLRRMRDEGRLSKVRHPSDGQIAGKTVPDDRAPTAGRTCIAIRTASPRRER